MKIKKKMPNFRMEEAMLSTTSRLHQIYFQIIFLIFALNIS